MSGALPTLHDFVTPEMKFKTSLNYVMNSSLPCQPGTERNMTAPLDDISPHKAYTLSNHSSVERMQNISEALKVVDPDHAYTLPYETGCVVTKEAIDTLLSDKEYDANFHLYLQEKPDNIVQTITRDSFPFYWVIQKLKHPERQNTVNKVTIEHLSEVFDALLELLKGAYRMHTYQIAHGDLRIENLVFSQKQKRIRMIAFEKMFAYNLKDPMIPQQTPRYMDTFAGMSEKEVQKTFKIGERSDLAPFKYTLPNTPPESILICKRPFLQPLVAQRILDNYTILLKPYNDTYWYITWEHNSQYITGGINSIYEKGNEATKEDFLNNYNPDGFTVYQLGFVLMQTCHELHDRLNAGKFKRLFPSMQDLITYMMFPEPTHRASWHDAIRLLEQWCYDLRKIELPGIASAKPVQKRLYVFRFSLDAASRSRERRTITLKDRRAQTLLDSILDNPTTCKRGQVYFSALFNNEKKYLNDKTFLWILHDNASIDGTDQVPRVEDAVAIAMCSNDKAGTLYIDYLCATLRATPGAGQILFRTIAAFGSHNNQSLLTLEAATDEVQQVYNTWGMLCGLKKNKYGKQIIFCKMDIRSFEKHDIPEFVNVPAPIIDAPAAAAARPPPPPVPIAATRTPPPPVPIAAARPPSPLPKHQTEYEDPFDLLFGFGSTKRSPALTPPFSLTPNEALTPLLLRVSSKPQSSPSRSKRSSPTPAPEPEPKRSSLRAPTPAPEPRAPTPVPEPKRSSPRAPTPAQVASLKSQKVKVLLPKAPTPAPVFTDSPPPRSIHMESARRAPTPIAFSPPKGPYDMPLSERAATGAMFQMPVLENIVYTEPLFARRSPIKSMHAAAAGYDSEAETESDTEITKQPLLKRFKK